ncbi:hypothetical protein [Streptococcus suis]|nr:hypothetical protein [Streptococcus suis]
MEIKLLKNLAKESPQDFEERVNEFMATVEVVDVKYTEATSGDYEAMTTELGLLVLYK